MSEKVTIKVERKELHLPTIALRGLVVFPNNLVHFEVGREKSIAAVEWAMANNSNVFLVAQKEMETSEPNQQDLYTYGVVAEVKQVLRVSDELVKVLVDVNDEKEIQEYKVEELKFKPRHKKVKLSAEEVKACANLEKEN